LKAGGADETFVVLGDAFAAEGAPALWATRGGFPLGMVEAALVDEGWHGGRVKDK